MSSLTFKALIDSVHFDPKKGSVKIQLIGASHISLDKLTTLAPKDDPVSVTLESDQTKIGVFTPNSAEEMAEQRSEKEELEEICQIGDEFVEEPDGEKDTDDQV